MTQLLLLAFLFAPQEISPGKCSLSGTVVNATSGEPVSNVEIIAESSGNKQIIRTPFTTSDSKGSFSMVDLVPGQYRLRGMRNGYLSTYFGARRAEGGGTPIRVEAGQHIKGLQFKIVPFSVIAGTIRDADGEALARAVIALRRVKFERGRRRLTRVTEDTYTDDLGQYRIHGLPPGKYYVCAEAPRTASFLLEDHSPKSAHPIEALVASLYPGVQELAAARPVELAAGARVTGVDITLARSSTVRVRGRAVVVGAARLRGVFLNTDADMDGFGAGMEARMEPNGDFEFPAVPPGSYTLTAVSHPPAKPSSELFEMLFYQGEYKGRVPLQVGRVAVEGIRVVVEGGAEVAGEIVDGNGNTKLNNRIHVRFDNGIDEPTDALVKDHKFATNLSPGHYLVDVMSDDLVVRSIRSEGRDVLEEGLTILGSDKVLLEVTVAKDGGQLDGAVLDKGEKPVAGATVVLVPEKKLRSHASLFQQCETDQYGSYQFQRILPGTYKLLAWSGVEPGAWWDPDFLNSYEEKADTVTVKANAHEVAKLYLTPAHE